MLQIHADHVTIHMPNTSGVELLGLPVRGESADFITGTATIGAGSTPALGELWPGQGGYYVGILPAVGVTPAQYLIASTQESEGLKWGPYREIEGVGSRTDGRANTKALMAAGGQEFPAAWWCSDMQVGLISDFHLPAQAELFLASLYAPQLFKKQGWYWSSTQYSRYDAFVQDFEHGRSSWYGKASDRRVRAFRWIQCT